MTNEQRLIEILNDNEHIQHIFSILEDFKQDFYIGAGFIINTVWNRLLGYSVSYGISDVDIIYFDKDDSRTRSGEFLKKEIQKKLNGLSYELDVTNQASVHLWYEDAFGFAIEPYTSLEDAVSSWPTTASSIAVRKNRNGTYRIYAPYGLDDLFNMVVRPNKRLVTKEIYEQKAYKWKSKWPELTIISWDDLSISKYV